MNTRSLEKFAQTARRTLHEQVAARLARVLAQDSPESRQHPEALHRLQQQIAQSSRQAVVEKAAYTWFNRLCALRFMDANGYTRMGTVSPAEGYTQPEILQEAKQGYIDEDLPVDREAVFGLLGGRLPSPDPQQEAYRLLLVGVCNYYHGVMPFLFERIDDYTELLMPGDLLSQNSIVQAVRDALTPQACADVEVIGWLYQFYISEKKDAVIGAKTKIAAEDIPAATQLFTPHWIVRYLVENSLGRLWLLNRPDSKLAERMPYYIAPEQPESDGLSEGRSGCHSEERSDEESFLAVRSPEELRICDPAAGSGHMLTYAFDLLHAIYEEEGYNPVDIPRLILERNLYGMEIDERAGGLAAFALSMKARARDRRFFRRGVRPHICVYRPQRFEQGEIESAPWLQRLADNLLDLPLVEALAADLAAQERIGLVGSLLRPQLSVAQIAALRQRIDAGENLFSQGLNDRVRAALEQMEYLARRYHVVIANPPYMGGKNLNDDLKEYLAQHYPTVKSDLFSAFIVRNLELTLPKGQLGFMTPFVWMFISSYEKLRKFIIAEKTITSLVQLEYSGFAGATVPICTFTLENAHRPNFKGGFVRLSDFRGADNQAPRTLEAIADPACGWFYRAAAADFAKIPGSPIAYWVSERMLHVFETSRRLKEIGLTRLGMTTANNALFTRLWHEVDVDGVSLNSPDSMHFRRSNKRWVPYNKGGQYRKWYGNLDTVLFWENDGHAIKNYGAEDDHIRSTVPNTDYYFRDCITWSKISSAAAAFRYRPRGSIFDVAGACIFLEGDNPYRLLGLLNTRITYAVLRVLSPTLNFEGGQVSSIPIVESPELLAGSNTIVPRLIGLSRADWDSYETSWDFTGLPLLRAEFRRATLAETYAALRSHWQAMTDEMQRLEEENNRLFIDAYGLQDELTPDVPLSEITLTCNPHYRYGGERSAEELEALLLADTMRELVSYAVGCMFGRYSLDKPGLILANQGETLDDYLRQVPQPTFAPDGNNAIPILDGEWFPDDIAARFREFLRVAFGAARYGENLAFVEGALGRDIRSYFLREFYADHVKRYQKRPIYWLFSSPKGSFNVLVYMHRYRPDTASVALNDYLREFRAKLEAHRRQQEAVSVNESASRGDRTRALKEMAKVDKTLAELRAYEDEALYPLAARRVEIDLDDGVKVNYAKLGPALKRVPGLE